MSTTHNDVHSADTAHASDHASVGSALASTRVLIYSDDSTIRAQVIAALGRRISAELPPVVVTEVATGPALLVAMGESTKKVLKGGKGFDLLILDGEAVPEGGMGLARQIKDEFFNSPPILLLVGRPDDAWLATWSRAEGYLAHPIDPFALVSLAAKILA